MQIIDISIQYETLLRFEVSHAFFGNEKPNIFRWKPTPETQRLLSQMGILVRYNTDCLILLLASSELEMFEKKLAENPRNVFSFTLTSDNVYFNHITNIPLEQKGKAYYFQSESNRNGLLHEGAFAAQSDFLPTMAGRMALSGYQAGEKLTASYIHSDAIKAEFEADANGIVHISVEDMPFGKYTLAKDGQAVASFLHLPSKGGETLVGCVDFVLEESLAQSWIKNFAEEVKIKTLSQEVKFETRDTYWRYYFVSKYVGGLAHVEIESGSLGLDFAEPTEITLPNGADALCFESTKPMPLLKKAIGKPLQLVRKKDSKGNAIRQVLCKVPFPTFEGIRAESRQADAKVFSDVVLYV